MATNEATNEAANETANEAAGAAAAGESPPGIVCPLDRLSLVEEDEGLRCPEGHRWDVCEAIPRMVPGEGRYTDAFGLQWNRFRTTQLDSRTGTGISRDRLRRCMGEACWRALDIPPASHVLEAGCGAGRFTEILLDKAHAHVTSIDQSAAVDANRDNFPQSDRHRIVQADIGAAPFAPRQFDVVLCLGVVQHTPDPERTIASLYRQVRPGGWLVLDHYTDDRSSSLGRLTRASIPVRALFKRLPPDRSLYWTRRLVEAFFPLHRAARDSRTARRLLSRVSPVLTYFDIHPELGDRLQYEWALLDTYDALTDYYKHKRSKERIETCLREIGATEVWCEYGGNGVEARCRRPPAETPAARGNGAA